MSNEIWKDIPGYEGIYQVSNTGKVKSLERFVKNSGRSGRLYKERILKPNPNKWGYLSVVLQKEGKRKDWKIHRLVLSIFNPVENWEELEVNHIDGDKENNNLKNLEWATKSENQRHRYDVLKKPNGSKKVGVKAVKIETGETQEFEKIIDCANYYQIPPSTLRGYLTTGRIWKKNNIQFFRID